MPTTKPTTFQLDLDAFGFSVLFYVGQADARSIENFALSRNFVLRDLKDDFSPVQFGYGYCVDLVGGALIYLSEPPTDSQKIGFLAHEAIHAANSLCRWTGIQASQDNDEFITYTSQWIITKCLEKTTNLKSDGTAIRTKSRK